MPTATRFRLSPSSTTSISSPPASPPGPIVASTAPAVNDVAATHPHFEDDRRRSPTVTIDPTIICTRNSSTSAFLRSISSCFCALDIGEIVALLLGCRLDLDLLCPAVRELEPRLVILLLPGEEFGLRDHALRAQRLISGDQLAQPVVAHFVGGHLPVYRRLLASGFLALADLGGVGGLQLGEVALETLDLCHRVHDLRAQQLLLDTGDVGASHDVIARLHEHLEHEAR